MAKNIIRLTESDLHRIVKESVERILNEVKLGLPNDPSQRDKVYQSMRKNGLAGEMDDNGQFETPSLHGDDPKAWYALRGMRNDQYDDSMASAEAQYKQGDKWGGNYYKQQANKQLNAANRNLRIGNQVKNR